MKIGWIGTGIMGGPMARHVQKAGLSLPGLSLVHQLYVAVKAQGHGRSTTQSLYLALKSLSGLV